MQNEAGPNTDQKYVERQKLIKPPPSDITGIKVEKSPTNKGRGRDLYNQS